MIKNSSMKIALFVLLCIVLSSSAAQATPLTFRLLIEVGNTVKGNSSVVITDNTTAINTFPNGTGTDVLDLNANEGVIGFDGFVGNAGYVSTTVAFRQDGPPELTLSSFASWTKNTNYVRFILEEVYTATQTTGTLTSALSGYDSTTFDPEGVDPTAGVGGAGAITSGSVSFQSFANTSGLLPVLGGDGAYTALNGAASPGGVAALLDHSTFTSTLPAGGIQSGSTAVNFNFDPLSPTYSMYTIVTITPNTASSGNVNFSADTKVVSSGDPLINKTTVPEPTSLLLLGSGLLALAFVRRRLGQTA